MPTIMLPCGSIDDVYSYEKMRRRPTVEESPPLSPPTLSQPSLHKKTTSFSISAPVSPTSAKLGAKKSTSFRWITRQSGEGTSSGNSERRVGTGTNNMAPSSLSVAAASATLPPKKPTKRIGFIDILLGYHSLLHASPSYPAAAQRRELYPTIGFIRNPDYGTQTSN